jgi:flagellar basal-body rod protein FlgC
MSLFGALAVSGSGMDAQRARAELLVQNLANSETTRTPEGGPYRRKDVVFSSSPVDPSFDEELGSAIGAGQQPVGVSVSDVVTDMRPPERRYMPGHPDADKDGYVLFPNINPAEDMADLISANRGYDGNIAAIAAVKDMISQSIQMLSA